MGFEPGFIILFMGSIMYAVQIILIGRYIKEADPLILVTIQVMMGVVVNLAMAVLLRETFEFSMVKEAFILLGESLSLVQGAGCAILRCNYFSVRKKIFFKIGIDFLIPVHN